MRLIRALALSAVYAWIVRVNRLGPFRSPGPHQPSERNDPDSR